MLARLGRREQGDSSAQRGACGYAGTHETDQPPVDLPGIWLASRLSLCVNVRRAAVFGGAVTIWVTRCSVHNLVNRPLVRHLPRPVCNTRARS